MKAISTSKNNAMERVPIYAQIENGLLVTSTRDIGKRMPEMARMESVSIIMRSSISGTGSKIQGMDKVSISTNIMRRDIWVTEIRHALRQRYSHVKWW